MNSIIPLSIAPMGMINCFLIKGSTHYILADTGVPNSEANILKQLKELRISKEEINLMILTHAHIDHFGSAARMKEILNVPVLAHRLDEPYFRTGQPDTTTMKPTEPIWNLLRKNLINKKTLPVSIDIVMEADEVYSLHPWGVEGVVIHTPGHTKGSLSIILENGEAIIMDMMASGILLGGIMLRSRVKHPPFHDDFKALHNSFTKVLSYPGDRYYLGHGGPVTRQKVKEYHELFL
ncbi:MAG: MBL fold metallo-hydrolase [Bacteroidetes bacterium]|nr:MBL fold metallo-hydrolase [Bacteroidota bacterium]